MGVIDLRLCRAQVLLRLIEQDLGGKPPLQERFLPLEIVTRFRQLAFRGGQGGSRRSQGVRLVLRIEFRQDLVRLDVIADASRSLDDPPANAKGESRLVFCQYLPGQYHHFAMHALFGSNGSNRARPRSFGFGTPVAAREQHGERRYEEQFASQAASCFRIDGARSPHAVLCPELHKE